MKSTTIVVSFAAVALAATAVSAQTPAPAAARLPGYVTAEQLNAPSILPTPPANDSWKTLEELAELHRLQETRTAEQSARAQADDKEESIFAFADVLGPKLNRASLPLTAHVSDRVKGSEPGVVNPAKKAFQRPRPYHLDATLKPICKVTENRADFSYPSGHGVSGYLEVLTLVQMIPEKRDVLLARADDYAHNREVCGVHYPSDEAASKSLAYALFALIQNHPEFKADLAAATSELRTALGLGPLPVGGTK